MEAIDPDADMRPLGNNRFVKPFLIFGDDPPRVGSAEDAAGATIDGLGGISVDHLVLDLAFVSVHFFAGNTAIENA